MFVLLTYYFDDAPSAGADKCNFLLNLGRLSLKHKFLAEGVVLAKFHLTSLETIVKDLSANTPTLHLIVSLGVLAGFENTPTIVSTPGILDTKDWHC